MKFKLKVIQINALCDFDLSWGKGCHLNVQVEYPTQLSVLYSQWQKAYLNYYSGLRGKVTEHGAGRSPTKDWRAILVAAETQFLDQFHRWLLSAELFPLRREIANAASHNQSEWVDVFLTSITAELARFPWETWQIGTDINAIGKIRIARTPKNIQYEPVRPLRRKARILAIFGDDTGVDLELDHEALQQQFHQIAQIKFKGWKRGDTDNDELKNQICKAIADERGWDILFFAGHSNEAGLMGGELRISPQVSLFISELEPCLRQAKKNGLQFAIFNSCSGIDIADSLINLGFNQVVVMREPIHNKVAQEFLPQFLQCLADYKDVHEAIREAYTFFKQQEKRLNYPSAYLIPSIFRHPEAELFRLQKSRWFRFLSPHPLEAIALSSLLGVSLLPLVQDTLLNFRLYSQAVYRQQTGQVNFTDTPPVRLIQIDKASLQDSLKLSEDMNQEICPINYRYFGQIINKINQLNVSVVGIDYILDQHQKQPENSIILSQAIQAGVEQNIWFILGQIKTETIDEGVSPEMAQPNWIMEGDINFFPGFVELLSATETCDQRCPFAYLLALTYRFNSSENLNSFTQPQLKNPSFLQTSLFETLSNFSEEYPQLEDLYHLKLPKISEFFQWFHPIVDLSIPPDQVYETMSAKDLLNGSIPYGIEEQVTIIAPGGYRKAGTNCAGEDNFTFPLAISFWQGGLQGSFTGGEYHAYMVHHLLKQRLVIPIPDFWMILGAAFAGKATLLILEENKYRQKRLMLILGGTTCVYLLMILQIYISLGILIPCLFPIIVFWSYILGGRIDEA